MEVGVRIGSSRWTKQSTEAAISGWMKLRIVRLGQAVERFEGEKRTREALTAVATQQEAGWKKSERLRASQGLRDVERGEIKEEEGDSSLVAAVIWGGRDKADDGGGGGRERESRLMSGREKRRVSVQSEIGTLAHVQYVPLLNLGMVADSRKLQWAGSCLPGEVRVLGVVVLLG
jgi:hypothetical protein